MPNICWSKKIKPISLICYESVSAFKDFYIKWHYITLQNIYDKFKGNIRKQKIEALNKHWQSKYALKDKQDWNCTC